MRVFASLLAVSLALAAPAYGQPRRVASLNLCTDELLLLLGRPEQIVSVTHLAQDPAETPLWAAARRHARNDGSLVSVVAMRPDLVLTMGGGGRDRGRIAPGYFADLTVLDLDPVTCEPAALLDAQVVMTVIEGEVVYRRAEKLP